MIKRKLPMILLKQGLPVLAVVLSTASSSSTVLVCSLAFHLRCRKALSYSRLFILWAFSYSNYRRAKLKKKALQVLNPGEAD